MEKQYLESLEKFRKDGFWIVQNAVDEKSLLLLEEEISAFKNNSYGVPWLTGTYEYPDEVNAVHFPHRVSEKIYNIALDKKITAWASLFCGANYYDWDGHISLVQSMLYMKSPGKRGQPWHQDELFTPTRDRSLVTVWTAIDQATTENGCIWVIPGSHKYGRLFPTRLVENSEEWVRSDLIDINISQAIPLVLSPGDVAYFSGYLVHGSYKNKSLNKRRSLVLNYKSYWSPSLLEAVCEHGGVIDFSDASKAILVDIMDPAPFSKFENGVLAR